MRYPAKTDVAGSAVEVARKYLEDASLANLPYMIWVREAYIKIR